jgi:hypothetical protein
MARKNHKQTSHAAAPSRPSGDGVLVEFTYAGEHGGWVSVPVGPVPAGIPPAQLRYAQHMGWIGGTAAEVTDEPEAPESEVEADDATILG